MLYAAKLQNLWENIIISFDFFTILIKELPNGRSKLSKFDLNRSKMFVCLPSISYLRSKKMEKKWLKTEQMLDALKGEPNVEQQYCHYLGGILRSTHWLEYSSKREKYGDSTNWFDYTWYTESEFLEVHANEWWMREV